MSHEIIEVTEADKEHLRQKINDALTHNVELAEKYREQLELLEDALVIYKLSHRRCK